eukprot:scaffold8433_cov21-Tisochrysis_lutea.AAC.3
MAHYGDEDQAVPLCTQSFITDRGSILNVDEGSDVMLEQLSLQVSASNSLRCQWGWIGWAVNFAYVETNSEPHQ